MFSANQDPDGLVEIARQAAAQILGLPKELVDLQMRALWSRNPVLHTLIETELERLRNLAR